MSNVKTQEGFAEQLQSSFTAQLPSKTTEQMVKIDVKVGFGSVMHDYVSELYYTMSQHMSPTPVPFSEADLELYLKRLLQQRVLHCTKQRTKIGPRDTYAVPAMFSVLLEMIGVCEDVSRGIMLIPVCDATIAEIDAEEEFMYKVSNDLKFMSKQHGFVNGIGYPLPRHGDIDFMSFEIIEGQVRHMADTEHPAYAVAVAMLGLTGLATFFGKAIYRTSYGYVSDYAMRARDLAGHRATPS